MRKDGIFVREDRRSSNIAAGATLEPLAHNIALALSLRRFLLGCTGARCILNLWKNDQQIDARAKPKYEL